MGLGETRVGFLSLALCVAATASARAATVLSCGFDRDGDMEGWVVSDKTEASIQTLPDGSKALRIRLAGDVEAEGGLSRVFPAQAVAGRRIRFSAEFMGEGIAPAKDAYNGAKFSFRWRAADGKNRYPQGKMRRGDFDWEPVAFEATLPDGVADNRLSLGFQDSFGTLWVRNLKVEATDAVLDLAPVANMGLKDEVAGDGKGGWSDQGPGNDARDFPFFKPRAFAKVPFVPTDPDANDGKAVAVFASEHFPQGLPTVSFDLATHGKRGRYLYLLHTACFGAGLPNGLSVGFIDLIDDKGAVRTLPVKYGEDVKDWWKPVALPNGAVGVSWTTAAANAAAAEKSAVQKVGMYVSRFDLGENAPPPARLTLRSAGGRPIWIVAAATLSDVYYPIPGGARFPALAEDGVWKPLRRPAAPTVVPGSALDRSVFLPPATPAGSLGRLTATPEGKLAFADAPNVAVRFFSSCDNNGTIIGDGRVKAQLDSHEKIEAYVRELRANGYNMTRLHFVDSVVSRDAMREDGTWNERKDGGFNARTLDRIEYFIHCLKQSGIYINLDAMTDTTGYTGVPGWSAQGKRLPNHKFHIHFDENIRRNWVRGVEELLTRVNPYTRTKLAEDPVLAMVVGYNEQAFAFTRFLPADPGPAALARWRSFLRERYATVAALDTAWGADAPRSGDFDAVPFFTRADVEDRNRTAKGADVKRFMRSVERATQDWYRTELRRMGYDGLFVAGNMGTNWHYADLRDDGDAVLCNPYHDHPTGGFLSSGATVTHASSVGDGAMKMRRVMGVRLAGKPFGLSEHANVFWNRYRYEQAFVTGGYGAFQGFDLLTAYAMPVSVNNEPPKHMHSYAVYYDPILRASEFLTFFLFRRGDVRPAEAGVRIVVDLDEVYGRHAQNEGISTPQSQLALTTGLSVSVTRKGRGAFPVRARETTIAGIGGAATILDDAGFETAANDIRGETFDLDAFVRDGKRRGLLPANNRTASGAGVFESGTGELYMDAKRNFLSISTPRLQGICGEAGSVADLGVLRIDEMTVKGNLALVSVDGEKPLSEAERMVLVFATDALNTGMSFHDGERRVLQNIGGNPTLVETGRFRIAVRHALAPALRLWALDMGGARRSEAARAEGGAGEAVFAVDTAVLPDGPAVFFELATE